MKSLMTSLLILVAGLAAHAEESDAVTGAAAFVTPQEARAFEQWNNLPSDSRQKFFDARVAAAKKKLKFVKKPAAKKMLKNRSVAADRSSSSSSRSTSSQVSEESSIHAGRTRLRSFTDGKLAVERENSDGSKTTSYSDGKISTTHGNIESRSDGVIGFRSGDTVTYSNGQVVYDPIH